MMPNERKLRDAFIAALGVAPDAAVETFTYRGIKEWDSVAHMQLIAGIEAAFDIMLDTADVLGMSSYAIARTIVVRHGVDIEA